MTVEAAEMPIFRMTTEAELRQWMEANPGRVNDKDREGDTPLTVGAADLKNLTLVVWLLDEKGADVNATTVDGSSVLHFAKTPDMLTALLDRGADPTIANRDGGLPLPSQASNGSAVVVECLLQDPRVRATINLQDRDGHTALH
jgi:ankyrin repeat protein